MRKPAGPGKRAAVTPSSLTLVDGAKVELRELTCADYGAVVELSGTLSERDLYLRFFTAHPGYLDDWARTLTTRSREQCALGAFEGTTLIGLASYVKTTQPGYAEVSVVIAHQQHQRGVGTALLGSLRDIARANGIRHLVADVLAENVLMRKVIADGGWPCTQHLDGSVLSVDLTLD
ncbi:GNAT family N-acetyltransferase [Mycolicibacterium hodleri]|uniref:GNAT family N-acetyltransferase n=1 Tax=Mycolicibacterium hodleri TaxID=49897 RepID=A0A502E4S0_9MYCO|nr:GNAT family N-acetyltransferase [Mycolicibacterium hodleri]TPG32728.1 GNAT family N-acetyltransferase [Mycolicibacterium hodleri]